MSIVQRFARNLKAYRRARGLTQAALAQKAGFGWSHIAKLEACMYPEPTINTVARLARALKCTPGQLLA